MKLKSCRILALLLAFAMVMLTGCTTGEDTKYVAKYGETDVPAGVYIYYMMQALSEASGKVSDVKKDVLSQKIDDQPASDWVKTEALKSLKSYIAVESEFTRLGLELTDEEKNAAISSVNNLWENQSVTLEKNGIARSSVELVALNSQKMEKVFHAYYDKGGEKEVPDSEIEQYYKDNFVRVAWIVFSKYNDDGTPMSEEDLKTLDESAKQYVTDAETEKDFNVLIDRKSKEDAEKSGQAYTEHEHTTGFEHDQVIYMKQSTLPADLYKKIEDTTELDTPVFYEDTERIVIFVRKDLMADTTHYDSVKDLLVSEMKRDEYTESLPATADSVGVTLNDKAISRYTPKSVKSR